MRVGVIAYELEGEPTGVGRYLGGMLSGLAELDSGDTWRLFFHGEPFDHPLFADPRFEPVFAASRRRPLVWEQLVLPATLRGHGLDLVFSPSYSLPPALPAPGVVTVHDLSFELLPAEFGRRQRWRRRLLARQACRRAARVLTDSERTREELGRLYRLPAEKIAVVPLGIELPGEEAPGSGAEADDGGGGRGTVAETLAALGVETPYLLYLGALLPRRQPRLMLEAFAELARRGPGLELVLAGPERLGEPGQLEGWIGELGLGDRVRRLGYVADEAVGPLYRGAELTLYLSAYEGYGLPPLESLARGTAAVVGEGPALDELWPDYPYRCRRLERAEVVAVAERALADPAARQRVVAEARRRLAGLTWRRAAERLLAEIERARR